METKYSRSEFEGYTHRFKLEFNTNEPFTHNMDIYSNSGSGSELYKYIKNNMSASVIDFCIVCKSTKEQDDKTSEFLNDFLKDF